MTPREKKRLLKEVPPPKKSARSVTNAVLNEVLMERSRQDEKWGEQNHPDLPPGLAGSTPERFAEDLEIPFRARAQFLCQQRFANKQGTWASIAVEELCEAVESAACQTQAELRTELVQLCAVCVAWIEAVDRRGK